LDDQIKKNELGEYVACMGERRGVYRVWWGNLSERDHLEDPGLYGRIILRWIFRKLDWGGMDWLKLAQDMAGGSLLFMQ
jgi:hypothetical protein